MVRYNETENNSRVYRLRDANGVVAAIGALGSLIGVWSGYGLVRYRMDQAERALEKHEEWIQNRAKDDAVAGAHVYDLDRRLDGCCPVRTR